VTLLLLSLLTDWSCRATSAKHVMWANRSKSGSSVCDGVPYVVLGRRVMECRYGMERHVTAKEKKKKCSSVSFVQFYISLLFQYQCHVTIALRY